jgi:hypothetical protein
MWNRKNSVSLKLRKQWLPEAGRVRGSGGARRGLIDIKVQLHSSKKGDYR